MEAADNFSNQPGFGNIICIQEAQNYVTGLTTGTHNPIGFRASVNWQDPISGSQDVYDTDFTDPDFTGHAYDDDTDQFDKAGTFSAYFCGHGMCDDDPANGPSCTASSQCNSPPAGSSLPGACIGSGPPTNSPGRCTYLRDRNFVINGVPFNQYGGYLDYTNGGIIKWGENRYTGNWAGASTNGGSNFSIISNSCGLRPPYYYQETRNLFAGLQLLGIIMPITANSDDVDAPDRGTYVAQGYAQNANSSVGLSFAYSILSMAQSEGGGCPAGAPNYTYGGGHGIGGCGASDAISAASTASEAQGKATVESWYDMNDPSLNGTGNGYFYVRLVCNYDCNTYPGVLP
jgi:hypothetical protein